MNSFGVFQTYYVDFLGRSESDVSWIGSIQVFLTFFIGTFTGRLTDAGYFRPVFSKQDFLLSVLRDTLKNDICLGVLLTFQLPRLSLSRKI
jgi:hypothetical protein